jgi:beta-lactamase superfamily II metal-dependent hydrolase
MVGEDNDYGHPHDEVLERLAKEGTEVYRTDVHGTVVITTDGRTYDVWVSFDREGRAIQKAA